MIASKAALESRSCLVSQDQTAQPVPPDSPLFACPRLLMTPHVAAITATSLRQMSVGAAEEMLRILRGERPLNLVNPESLSA